MTRDEFRTIRRDLNLTMTQLAMLFGVTRRTVQAYERERSIPRVVTLLMGLLRENEGVRRQLIRAMPPRPPVGRPVGTRRRAPGARKR